MTWQNISTDPNNSDARDIRGSKIDALPHTYTLDKKSALIDFVRDKKVLDIGIVEHDRSYMQRTESWEHGFIAAEAKYCLGIDILEEDINHLVSQGFNAKLFDATSKESLGELFERIVIGDVIEHVDSPSALLEFALRHLDDDGEIWISTPNPYFISYVIGEIIGKPVIPNLDHVCWISPSHMIELTNRTKSQVLRVIGVGGLNPQGLLKSLVSSIINNLLLSHEVFSQTYVYVIGKANPLPRVR